MDNFRRLALVIFSSILFQAQAHAVLIVDTGPTSGGGVTSLARDQYLAAEFVISNDWTINSLEGWMINRRTEGTATVVIYADGGTVPGAEIYSSEFTSSAGIGEGWQGGSSLDWFLSAGTYWAGFELRAGQTLFAGMPTARPSPLPTAFFLDLNGRWSETDRGIGVRIDAQEVSATVPTPATLFLVGVALLGVRKKVRCSEVAGSRH